MEKNLAGTGVQPGLCQDGGSGGLGCATGTVQALAPVTLWLVAASELSNFNRNKHRSGDLNGRKVAVEAKLNFLLFQVDDALKDTNCERSSFGSGWWL